MFSYSTVYMDYIFQKQLFRRIGLENSFKLEI